MSSPALSPDSPHVVPFRPRAQPYYVLSSRDSILAARNGEELAGTHFAEYLEGDFTDLAGLETMERALGAYALRFPRKVWRQYAYQQAVSRGMQIVTDQLTHCFLEPSASNPAVLVKMHPERIKAMVSVLATEMINAHRHALDGTCEPTPGDLVRLHAAAKL
jgi:DNA phosphorothioation-dependent restriction protein DptG